MPVMPRAFSDSANCCLVWVPRIVLHCRAALSRLDGDGAVSAIATVGTAMATRIAAYMGLRMNFLLVCLETPQEDRSWRVVAPARRRPLEPDDGQSPAQLAVSQRPALAHRHPEQLGVVV